MTPGTTTQERCCGVRKSAMTSDIRSYIVRGGEAPTVSALTTATYLIGDECSF
jgi:hypothetical protein